jgi:uncharacterized protein with PQ loop repeat
MEDIIQIGPNAENGLRKLGKDLKAIVNQQVKLPFPKSKNTKTVAYLMFTAFFVSVVMYAGFLIMSNPQELIGKLPVIAGVGIASAIGMTLFS